MSTDEFDRTPSREPGPEQLDEASRAARSGLTDAEDRDPYGSGDPFAEWESEDAGVAELMRTKSQPSTPPSSPSGMPPLIMPPSLARSTPPASSPRLSSDPVPSGKNPSSSSESSGKPVSSADGGLDESWPTPKDPESPDAPDIAEEDEPNGASEPPVARRPDSLIPMRIIRVDSNPPEESASGGQVPSRPPAPTDPAGDASRSAAVQPDLESRDVRDSDIWPVSMPSAPPTDPSDEARTPLRPPRPSVPSATATPPSVSIEKPELDVLGQLSIDDEPPPPPRSAPARWDDEAATVPGGRTAGRAKPDFVQPRSFPPPRPSPASPRVPRPASLTPEVTTSWGAAEDDEFDIRETVGGTSDSAPPAMSTEAPAPETRPASPAALAGPAQPPRPETQAKPDARVTPEPTPAEPGATASAPGALSPEASTPTTPVAEESSSERRGRPPPPRARITTASAPEPASEAAQASEPVRSRPPVPPRARQRLGPTSEAAEAPARREGTEPAQEASGATAAPAAQVAEPVEPSTRTEREGKPAPRMSRPPKPSSPHAGPSAEPASPVAAAPPGARAPEIAYEELTPESDRSAEESPKSMKRPPPPKRAARRAAEPAAAQSARPETPRPEEKEPETPSFVKGDQKRLRRPWWEDVFSEDFIRAERRLTPSEISRECDFIVDSLGVQSGGVVLDIACGSGAHTVELASRGFSVVGFDLSLYQLALAGEHAQERKQRINFLQGDVREMGFESMFDAVLCWNTSFGYFEEEKNAVVAERIFHALRPEGTLLLDVANRDFVSARQPSQTWFNGDACVCMDDTNIDYITSRLRVKRSVILDDGRTRECHYSIRLYSLHELGKLLHDVGFHIVEVSGHPSTRGAFFGETSPRLIVLAQRP
jgi:SAM-dependent methyltransferase